MHVAIVENSVEEIVSSYARVIGYLGRQGRRRRGRVNEESLNQFIKEVIQGLKKISDDFQREVADENNEEFRKALAEIKIDQE